MKKYIYLLMVLPTFLFYQNCGQSGDIALESKLDAKSSTIAEDQPEADFTDVSNPSPTPTNPGLVLPPAPVPVSDTTQVAYVLEVSATPRVVKEQETSDILIKYKNLTKINYLCQDKNKTTSFLSGSISLQSSEGIHSLKTAAISADTYCEFSGESAASSMNPVVKTNLALELNCMNKIKNESGRCEDFKCLKVMTLSLNDLTNVPARTSEGICYAVKLMSGIANSSSSLSQNSDSEVISRNHDSGGNSTRNPYVLGSFSSEINLAGERVVKLSGGLDASKKILVDNFVLTGVYPVSTNDSANELAKYYKVRGTSDSAISNSQSGVKFRQTLLPVIPFGPSGTSSVAPIDISAEVIPQVPYILDIRALDCGGARELSDIYLLFQ